MYKQKVRRESLQRILFQKRVDAIIVLGAGVREDGTPSDILTDRLSTSLDILNMGVEGKLLVFRGSWKRRI